MEINLLSKEEDDVRKIYQYPDGQQQVVLKQFPYNSVHIVVSLRDWRDVELLYCTVASLRTANQNVKIRLTIAYLIGSRSDRSFEGMDNNYVKDVIGNLLNHLNFTNIFIFHPHSKSSTMFIKNASESGLYRHFVNFVKNDYKYDLCVAPDKGAVELVNQWVNYRKEKAYCSKIRIDGKPEVHIDEENRKQISSATDILIVDDICDGGRTFIEVAKAIRKVNSTAILSLAVTHGIFSNGYEELSKHFETIYTTNSYKNIPEYWYDGFKDRPTRIKQMKIEINDF